MIYYVFFFTILLFAVLLDVFKTKQLNTYEKQIFVLLSFFLILMSGLRLKTGYDFESYKQIFESVKQSSWNSLFSSGWGLVVEPGYMILNYLCKWMPFQLYIFLISTVSVFIKVLFIYKISNNLIMCLFIYYSMYFCSVCVHSVNCISENDTVLEQSFPIIEIPEGIILSNEYYKLELCKTGWLFQTSSYFIRTSVVRKFVNDYKENTYPVGDLPLILFSVAQGNCYYIKRFMSCYRMNSGGYMTKLKYNKNRITHCKEFINGHKNFDKITRFKYHQYFEYAIKEREIEIFLNEKNYRKIWSNKYYENRKNMSLRRKILLAIGFIFPNIAYEIERNIDGWAD